MGGCDLQVFHTSKQNPPPRLGPFPSHARQNNTVQKATHEHTSEARVVPICIFYEQCPCRSPEPEAYLNHILAKLLLPSSPCRVCQKAQAVIIRPPAHDYSAVGRGAYFIACSQFHTALPPTQTSPGFFTGRAGQSPPPCRAPSRRSCKQSASA